MKGPVYYALLAIGVPLVVFGVLLLILFSWFMSACLWTIPSYIVWYALAYSGLIATEPTVIGSFAFGCIIATCTFIFGGGSKAALAAASVKSAKKEKRIW